MRGEREEAVDCAIREGQYGLALLIAGMCGRDAYQKAAEHFCNNALAHGSPLHTIAVMFSSPPRVGISSQALYGDTPLELRASWNRHLAAIINNRIPGWELAVVALGDRLRQVGLIEAAHFCYMVCGTPVSSPVNTNCRWTLVGCKVTPADVVLSTDSAVESFLRTEAYEWAKRRGNADATIRTLQSFKAIYAVRLAEYGFDEDASGYVSSALECLGESSYDDLAIADKRKPLGLAVLSTEKKSLVGALDSLRKRLHKFRNCSDGNHDTTSRSNEELLGGNETYQNGHASIVPTTHIDGATNRGLEVQIHTEPKRNPTTHKQLRHHLKLSTRHEERDGGAEASTHSAPASSAVFPAKNSSSDPCLEKRLLVLDVSQIGSTSPPLQGFERPPSIETKSDIATPLPNGQHCSPVSNTKPETQMQKAEENPSPSLTALRQNAEELSRDNQPQQHAGHSTRRAETDGGSEAAPVQFTPALRTVHSSSARSLEKHSGVAQMSSTSPPLSFVRRPSTETNSDATTPLPKAPHSSPVFNVKPDTQVHKTQENPPPSMTAGRKNAAGLPEDQDSQSASGGSREGVELSEPKSQPVAPALEAPFRSAGQLPKAPSSAPANLHKSGSESPKSDKKKGWFNFGIRDYLVSKLHPEATVGKLGGKMEAYFDKDLGRWVFPGDDPSDLPPSAGPPPTAPLGTKLESSTQSMPAASSDPLSMMMAPPPARHLTGRRNPNQSAGASSTFAGAKSFPRITSTDTAPGNGTNIRPTPQFAVFKPQ